jgi:hypothetical protein
MQSLDTPLARHRGGDGASLPLCACQKEEL